MFIPFGGSIYFCEHQYQQSFFKNNIKTKGKPKIEIFWGPFHSVEACEEVQFLVKLCTLQNSKELSINCLNFLCPVSNK